MMGLRCFNIMYTYEKNDSGESDLSIALVDIETGLMAALFCPWICDMQLRKDIQKMIVHYIDHSGMIPPTLMFYGDSEISDEGLIFLHVYGDAAYALLNQKLCACYINILPDGHSFHFVDKCDDRNVMLSAVSVDMLTSVVGFVNSVYEKGYTEFFQDGRDSIIIGGNVSDVGDGFIAIENEEGSPCVFGTIRDIYDSFLRDMLKHFGG